MLTLSSEDTVKSDKLHIVSVLTLDSQCRSCSVCRVSVPVCLSVCLFLCLSHMSACVFKCPCVCLAVSYCVSVCLSVMCVSLSVCLSCVSYCVSVSVCHYVPICKEFSAQCQYCYCRLSVCHVCLSVCLSCVSACVSSVLLLPAVCLSVRVCDCSFNSKSFSCCMRHERYIKNHPPCCCCLAADRCLVLLT